MENRKRKIGLLSLAVLAGIGLTACKEEPKAAEVPAASAATAPVASPSADMPETPAAYTAPLTGLPSDQEMTSRPLVVMINNAPAARPQSGLPEADLVYEALAEGGITRLVAIYQSAGQEAAAKLGPVRSIRPYFIELGESYHGVLVHAGGSPAAYAQIQSQQLEELDEIGKAGPFFWRDNNRKAPHNLYTSLDELREGMDKLHFSGEDRTVPAYTFRPAEEELTGGSPASAVTLTYLQDSYKVTYKYDPDTKLYIRYIGDKPHTDKETGEPLTATNVVVMGADHKVLDDVGRLSVGLELGGEALLFERGQVLEGQWIHKEGDMIRFVKEGEEVPFYPGITYINIVPNSPDFTSHVQILSEP